MSSNLYSVFESVSSLIREKANLEFLAKMTVLVRTTLQSLNLKEGDVDKHYDLKIVLLKKDFDTLFRLSLISYFVDQTIGSLLRLAILEEIKEKPEFLKITLICENKIWFNQILSDMLTTKSESSIFGYFKNDNQWIEKLQNSFRIKRIRDHKLYNDPVFHQRFVGVSYKDKGHLPKSTEFPFSDQAQSWLQNRIEQERQSLEDLNLLVQGFLM